MRSLGLSSLLLLTLASAASAQSLQMASAGGPPQVIASVAPPMAAPRPTPRMEGGADLGGGLIEFLFTGGRMASPGDVAPYPRNVLPERRVKLLPAPYGYGAPGMAYAAPGAPTPAGYGAPSSAAPEPMTRPSHPLAPQFERQLVDYDGPQKPGTIVIDTAQRFLFLVQDDGKALRYGVGVGRAGFEWSGTNKIARKSEWPDWRPPTEMLKRRPDLPTFMAGGPRNPLGARAMYLGGTLYRIHGSNEPQSIGQAVSSGCIRMRNEDVIDLYDRVHVGTTVVVL